jgi:ribosomal protein L24
MYHQHKSTQSPIGPDKNQNPLELGDHVHVCSGKYKGRHSIVKKTMSYGDERLEDVEECNRRVEE